MERQQAGTRAKVESIERFAGPHRFLSNFYPVALVWEGRHWPTAEHAYQAAKCRRSDEAWKIQEAPSPGAAKRLGRKIELRADWDEVKEKVMLEVVRAKFENAHLRRLLIATGDAELIEGNYWGDRFWGVCRGEGENRLGKILMKVRTEIRS